MNPPSDNEAIVGKILSGARSAAVLRLAAQILSWLTTLFVVRFLTPADYGLNAMLGAPLELMLIISALGLDVALVRAKNLLREELRSAFGCLLVVNGILFLAYFFGSVWIASYFHEPRLEPLAKVLAFVFVLLPFRIVPDSLLNRELKFRITALVQVIAKVAAALTTLTLAILGAGVWALVIGLLVDRSLAVILLMFRQPWFMLPSLNFAAVRNMLAFGGLTTLSNALLIFSDKISSFVGGPLLGVEKLGLFAVAMHFAILPLSKAMPIINPLIFPAFVKFEGQASASAYYLQKALGILSLCLFPVLIGMACVANEFVPTILGGQWVDAVIPLMMLSIAMPFRFVTSILMPVMSSMGRVDLALKSSLMVPVLLFPLMLIGAQYGVMGLVLAVLVVELVVMFATIEISKSVLDTSIKNIAVSLCPSVVSSAVMAVGVYCASGYFTGIGGLMFEVCVGVIVYYSMLRIVFASTLEAAMQVILGRRLG